MAVNGGFCECLRALLLSAWRLSQTQAGSLTHLLQEAYYGGCVGSALLFFFVFFVCSYCFSCRFSPASATLLHVAASRGLYVIVCELLAWGADVTARDDKGNTSAAIAEQFRFGEIGAFLRSRAEILFANKDIVRHRREIDAQLTERSLPPLPPLFDASSAAAASASGVTYTPPPPVTAPLTYTPPSSVAAFAPPVSVGHKVCVCVCVCVCV
jgi:hypothetical protein